MIDFYLVEQRKKQKIKPKQKHLDNKIQQKKKKKNPDQSTKQTEKKNYFAFSCLCH